MPLSISSDPLRPAILRYTQTELSYDIFPRHDARHPNSTQSLLSSSERSKHYPNGPDFIDLYAQKQNVLNWLQVMHIATERPEGCQEDAESDTESQPNERSIKTELIPDEQRELAALIKSAQTPGPEQIATLEAALRLCLPGTKKQFEIFMAGSSIPHFHAQCAHAKLARTLAPTIRDRFRADLAAVRIPDFPEREESYKELFELAAHDDIKDGFSAAYELSTIPSEFQLHWINTAYHRSMPASDERLKAVKVGLTVPGEHQVALRAELREFERIRGSGLISPMPQRFHVAVRKGSWDDVDAVRRESERPGPAQIQLIYRLLELVEPGSEAHYATLQNGMRLRSPYQAHWIHNFLQLVAPGCLAEHQALNIGKTIKSPIQEYCAQRAHDLEQYFARMSTQARHRRTHMY
jgi:hypothetical protein